MTKKSKKKNITTSNDDNLLHMAGIRGVDYYTELFIYTSMFLGDPSCLIGRPGTAKTEVVKIIGQALNTLYRNKAKNVPEGTPAEKFKFQVYDASKLSFDELVGYPNPSLLKEGKMGFIQTELTVWDKDLVAFDEINRCAQETQNSLLEILRSRKCNGINTDAKFIFGTMNPYGGVATSQMVEALVDRFLFFLYFRDFTDMTDEDRAHIVNRVGDVDSVGLRFWSKEQEDLDFNEESINPLLLDMGTKLHAVLTRASEKYEQMKKDYGEPVNMLINKVSDNLKTKFKDHKIKIKDEVTISGRRAGMSFRAILGAKAVQVALYEVLGYPMPDMEPFLKRAIQATIPIGINGNVGAEDVQAVNDVINSVVTSYWSRLCSNSTELQLLHKLNCSNNLLEKIACLITNKDKLDQLTYNTFWSSLIDSPDCIKLLIKTLLIQMPNVVPPHMAVDQITSIEDITIRAKIGVEDLITMPEEFLEDLEQLKGTSNGDLEGIIFNTGLYYIAELNNSNLVPSVLSSMKTLFKFVRLNTTPDQSDIGLSFMDGEKSDEKVEQVI